VKALLKRYFRFLVYLLLLTLTIIVIGYFVIDALNSYMTLKDIIILSVTFSLISFITLFVFFIGQAKAPGAQLIYTFSGISSTFVLATITALIWFVVAKKLQTQYVLLFFILYLAFTFFSVMVILNVLKNKDL
jgi:hypothetical protein